MNNFSVLGALGAKEGVGVVPAVYSSGTENAQL